ncbi:NIF family HAD-type phosphatase [Psychrobacillus sp. NPDC093200]|uniref:NIF family HAD-type phosphatase n=1 Tax=Psychrobacillus sp. NPDC093200 TaxID=3390656 RepID=UPI003D02D9A3
MKKCCIFDMDGTLFQTNLILEPALEKTFNMLREQDLWNEDTPIEKYREIMGVTLPTVWKTLCPKHSYEIREKSNEYFHKQLIALIKNNEGALYPHAEKVLMTLSEDFEVFIASNGQEEYLKAIVETYDLEKYIKKVYSIQTVASGHKSELVERVLKENQITSGYVIGDRSSDINAAKDNNLIAIGVEFDFSQPEELEKANYIVKDLREVLEFTL